MSSKTSNFSVDSILESSSKYQNDSPRRRPGPLRITSLTGHLQPTKHAAILPPTLQMKSYTSQVTFERSSHYQMDNRSRGSLIMKCRCFECHLYQLYDKKPEIVYVNPTVRKFHHSFPRFLTPITKQHVQYHKVYRRMRSTFTTDQTETLSTRFNRDPYITAKERKDLAVELGMSEQQVKIWFQNKRYKMKRQLYKEELRLENSMDE